MKHLTNLLLFILMLSSFSSCAQNNKANCNDDTRASVVKENVDFLKFPIKTEPHRYGGWYCPDNLRGFPAVDIADWENVPVVNGRMPTKEETQNGTSLIFVDTEKYPNAKPLDMKMPRLARFYNENTRRKEIIIVIQALNIDNDAVIGFRYLNGGNGSSWLHEVEFIDPIEIEMMSKSKFVSYNIKINATQDIIWDIITNPEKVGSLQPIFDKDNKLKKDWKENSKVNFFYPSPGNLTASYASKLYGNFYIQNDFDHLHYNEKFLLSENKETKVTELIIVCGPYLEDYSSQTSIIKKWAKKVKELSEKKIDLFNLERK